MPKLLAALSLAAGIGLVCSQSAGAFPGNAAGVNNAATATSQLQHAQYSERPTRHGIVKCYRLLLVGPYQCHYYPRPS